ncbi:MAG: fatty acyl-AMP ligase [Xenococcaceae cyanobacterium]
MNPKQKFPTLVDLLSYRALHQPDQKAFIFLEMGEIEVDSLTYQELDRQAQIVASQLQKLGVRGERVLLLYPPGLEFIVAFFGCLYAGAIAVPANLPRPNRPLSQLQGIAADAQGSMVLTTTSLSSKLQRLLSKSQLLAGLRQLVTDNTTTELAGLWQKPLLSSDTLAFLQYTSGSTGTPKGVMVSHGNLLQNLEYIKQTFELTPESVSVSWLPSFHDMGLIDGILQPLYTGFPGVLMPPVSFMQKPFRWLKAISRYQATHCGGPNFGYDLCINKIAPEEQETLDLSSWCSAYNGAEPIRKEILERFAAKFAPCGFRASFSYPCYGLAESTLMVSGGLVNDEPIYCKVQANALEENRVVEVSEDTQNVKHLVGCGRAWLDTKILIVDPESLTQCTPEQVGEIWVSSSSVAQGYWKRPEETEETFRAYLADTGEGPFLRTGDLGFLQDGELFVTGRIKDMVIIRGRNYYPQDIELTVEKSHPVLRPSCGAAFAVEVKGFERLVVVHEVHRSYLHKLNVEEVVGTIGEAVMQHHDLQVYGALLVKTGSIPKTSSGKIRRKTCREKFLAQTLDGVGGKIGNSIFPRKPVSSLAVAV